MRTLAASAHENKRYRAFHAQTGFCRIDPALAGWRAGGFHDALRLHFTLYRSTKRVTGVTRRLCPGKKPRSGSRPVRPEKGVAATQRREGAKTQRSQFQSSLTRWINDSSPCFHSHFPALCVLASWRLCVEGLSWVQAVSCRSAAEFGFGSPARYPGQGRCQLR